jgi:hypothetical protein
MPRITIEVSGITHKEALELAKLLEEIEGVESSGIPPWKTRDHAFTPPGTFGTLPSIQASAAGHTIFLVLGTVVASKVLDSLVTEATKDGYAALKRLILRKLGEWRESKEPVRRERIVFLFDDDHMLVNKADDEDRPDA